MKFSDFPMYPLSEKKNELKVYTEPVKPLMDLPTIPEFYKDQEIFISGGSGFMGKVLIEKLLRSCPGIKKIYVLLRRKNGKSFEERLKVLKELPLFEPLKLTNPSALDKIIPIAGDVTELGLGMSPSDVRMMENVSIVFHSAASVRFDDPLKAALLMNTRGTREMVKFAENLKNIKVMMHVSTTYCNTDRPVVEEEIYPAIVNWEDAIKLGETLKDETLDILTAKYTKFFPNTYTFTKNLSEQVANDYKHKVPLVIFRPSIVISAMREPVPGWVDNFNGPIGLLVGCAVGVLRTGYMHTHHVADFTPVDICIKAMIVAAWKRAHEPKEDLPVYNCCTGGLKNNTSDQMVDVGRCLSAHVPMNQRLWMPGGSFTSSRVLNYIRFMIAQLFPAIIVDQLMKLSGKKPFLVRLQRKIFEATTALSYFMLNSWHFKNNKFLKLSFEIRPEDFKEFYFYDFLEFDFLLYMRNTMMGMRRYLMNNKDEDLPKARKNFQLIKTIDTVVRTIVKYVSLYIIFVKYDFVNVVKDYVLNLFVNI